MKTLFSVKSETSKILEHSFIFKCWYVLEVLWNTRFCFESDNFQNFEHNSKFLDVKLSTTIQALWIFNAGRIYVAESEFLRS